MAGWDAYAANFALSAIASGAVIFNADGTVYGKFGKSEVVGDLKIYLELGKSITSTPEGNLVNNKKFKYCRRTYDDAIVMKFNTESVVIVPIRISTNELSLLLYSEETKPEKMLDGAAFYGSQCG